MAMVTLDEMFAHPVVRARVSRMLDAPRGIVAVNGDAASGKSTTIFALAEELRSRGRQVTVIMRDQDMRDYLLRNTAHADWDIRMVTDTNDDWRDALAAVPADRIILAGELDFRTARPIAAAAERGATILTQFGTPYVGIDAAYSVQNNGIPTGQFLALFSCLAFQMLVPRLCSDCRAQVTLDPAASRQVDPGSGERLTVWKEVGCPRCEGTGLRGRLALHEVLMIDDDTRPILANYLENGDLRNPLPAGHVSLQEAARQLLQQGEIGLATYTHQITHNPILRMQHQWDLERRQSGRIREMFSRFVTTQVVDRILADAHVQAIVDGERRRITCMFADIRGFTTLAESMAPGELFGLLNLYFKEIIDIVQAEGGTIDKFVGDCVMVLFGAPVDQADHELRAVRSAIGIQRAVARLNAQRPGSSVLHMGIGINTGEAMTGCLGSAQRMDYTALGDTVNTAARLEAKAQGGQILVGAQTARAVQAEVACEPVGSLALKGKAQATEAFAVQFELS